MSATAAALPASLTAPAKLTRRLAVTGVRDDAMHLIEAEMVSLDLADRLELSAGDGLEVVDETPSARAGLAVPEGGANLVGRALRAVGRSARVRLVKRIPAGAGLGGGSSDAAAVLRWAGVGPDARGLALAATLGADVPFCLVGGRARVRGIGEQVEPMPALDAAFTVLLVPFGVSTAAVYRRWDEIGRPAGNGPNDLETAALSVAPALDRWRRAFAEATGDTPVLAGSGSSWFVEGTHPVLAGPFPPPAGLESAGSGQVLVCRTATARKIP